jgi:methyl-accepting chemotaxis protein
MDEYVKRIAEALEEIASTLSEINDSMTNIDQSLETISIKKGDDEAYGMKDLVGVMREIRNGNNG